MPLSWRIGSLIVGAGIGLAAVELLPGWALAIFAGLCVLGMWSAYRIGGWA